MLSRAKILKLAESTSNNPDESEWTVEFARLVEAEALRSVKRSWSVKLGDGTTRVDVRRINAHAKEAAAAAKEGR